MKTDIIKNICGSVCLLLVMIACNDSFLERDPTHDIPDHQYWKSVDNLKLYNNGIYNEAGDNSKFAFLAGHANGGYNSSYMSTYGMEAQSDNVASTVADHATYVRLVAGLEIIPSGQTRGGWYWELLRRCNIFLDHYDIIPLDDSVKNPYAGEVYFFRAWFYFDKVQNYGDVPLVLHALNEDSPELFEAQTPRKTVMAQVLSDINKAIEYLPESWSGYNNHPDRVTKDVARALKSRICLYEGTYNKYHRTDEGYDMWLKEAVSAAEEIMKSGKYRLHSTGNPEKDYRTLFTSPDLSGNSEVLMRRAYERPGMGHRISGYIVSQTYGATKDFVDDFLCLDADGKARPIASSTSYKQDSVELVFDNRDPRLAQIILDPRMEMEILKKGNSYPRFNGMGGWNSTTGYHFIKFYEYDDDQRGQNNEINDFPLFRYAEVLLNYAEAKAELNTIGPDDLQISVDLIRARAGMPPMDFKPEKDPKYEGFAETDLLVEIRRERRIELSFENFRFHDLMRWKQGDRLNQRYLGIPVNDKDFEGNEDEKDETKNGRFFRARNSIKTFEIDGVKYVDAYAGGAYAVENRQFANKHYLRPIPINVRAKNPNLKQNPEW